MTTPTNIQTPQGPGSVSGAPGLPAGFTTTFTSRYVDTDELRLHAVVGGDGPPILLIHGWPQTWYQFRIVMPALARNFTIVAMDQRGIGLSDKPETGYDAHTLAHDGVALMQALGHERFSVVGFDTGMLIAYALAADFGEHVERLVVGEAPLPGITPPLPLIVPDAVKARLWHIAFNQQEMVNEQLVTGREDIFIGAEYRASAGSKPYSEQAISYYVDMLSSAEALHGTFQMYRAFNTTAAQNAARTTKLTMPVLAIGGSESSGAMVEDTVRRVADDVRGVVFDSGHWIAEQVPDAMVDEAVRFLAPARV